MKAAGVLPATAKRGIYSTVGHVGHAPGGSSTFSLRWNEAMGEEVRQRISVPPVRRIWGGGLYGLYVITTNTPLNGPMIRYIKCRIGSMKIPLLLAASRMQDKQAQKPGHQVVLLGYDDKGNWTVHNPSTGAKAQGYTKMTNSELDLHFAKPLLSNYVTMYICKQLPKKNPLVSLSLPNLSFWFEGKEETGEKKPGKEDDYVEDKKWYAQFFWDWLNRGGPGYRFAKVKDLETASSANPKDTYKAIPGTAAKLVIGEGNNGGLVVINSSPDGSSPPVGVVVSVEFKNLDRPKDKPLVVKADHSLIPRKKRRARFEIPVNTTQKEKGLRDPKIQQKPWKYSMLAKVADKASGAVLDQKEIHFVLEPMPKDEEQIQVKFWLPPPAAAKKHTFKLKAASPKPQSLSRNQSAEGGSVLKKVWQLKPVMVEKPYIKLKPSQLAPRTIRLKRVSGDDELPVLVDVVSPGQGPGSKGKNRSTRLGTLEHKGDELLAKIGLNQWLEISAVRDPKVKKPELEATVEAVQVCLLEAWGIKSRPKIMPRGVPNPSKATGKGEIGYLWHAKGFNLPPGKTLKWEQGFFTGPGAKGRTVALRGSLKVPQSGDFYTTFDMFRASKPAKHWPRLFVEFLDPDPKAKKPLAAFWE